MRTREELEEKLLPHKTARYVYDKDVGYLSWGVGTGGNVEMLYLDVVETGKGLARILYRRFIEFMEQFPMNKPYYSVYAFTLAGNTNAQRFYKKLGFEMVNIGKSVYGGDDTVIMWCPYDKLKANLMGDS